MARILVIGNVNADEVVHVDAPPAPGAHLSGRDGGLRLGGGGANAAVALARAGHAVTPWAAIGDDAAGTLLLDACRAHGLDVSGLHRVAGTPSNRPLILIDPDGERTLIARRSLSADDVPLPPAPRAAIDGLLVKGYRPALRPILAAQVARGPVVAHAPPPGVTDWPATIWVTSASEPTVVAGAADPWAAARAVAGPALRWLVITHGAAGAEARDADGMRLFAPARPVPRVVDTTGAGDVFAAAVLHGLLTHAGMAASLDLAARWAARVVQTDGSVPPSDLCGADEAGGAGDADGTSESPPAGADKAAFPLS